MIEKIKRQLVVAATMLMLLVPTMGTVSIASAAPAGCTGISGTVAEGANAAISQNGQATGGQVNCEGTGADASTIKKVAGTITNIFSIIVGAASVIMIIYGGFRYVISGGESGRVGAAKNSLIYAIVGLLIVAIAQLIVHFVLNQAKQI